MNIRPKTSATSNPLPLLCSSLQGSSQCRDGKLSSDIVVNAVLLDLLLLVNIYFFFPLFNDCISLPACEIHQTLQGKTSIRCLLELIAILRCTTICEKLIPMFFARHDVLHWCHACTVNELFFSRWNMSSLPSQV